MPTQVIPPVDRPIARVVVSKVLIGHRIRTARQRQFPKMRQADVDDMVGIPRGRTAHYENGRAAAPHHYLVAIAEKWQIPVTWFLQAGIDELPAAGTTGVSAEGLARIELRGDLVACNLEPAEPGSLIEVDGRFYKTGSFACRMIGNDLAPKIRHGDFVIFWPTDRPRVGIISFAAGPSGYAAVIPAQVKGTIELQNPSGEGPVASDYRVSAYAVGFVRSLLEGDTMGQWNMTGLRFEQD